MANIIDFQQMGKRVQTMRLNLNLTQYELAKLSDTDLSYICKLERGNARDSLEHFSRVCRALDLSADFLLFGHAFNKDHLTIVCSYLEQHLETLRGYVYSDAPLPQPTVDPE